MADKIYLLRGNDTPMAVCLRKSEGEGDPVPYDLSTAERMRLAIVGHGMHVFASGVTVSGEDNNIVSGVIPGRSLLPGDYDLELTFVLDGRDKRFAVEDMFEAVNFLAEDADGTAEGEGDGISITVTVQPEVIEIAGPTGPQGKSAYEVWLAEGHTGDEDDFFRWLAAQTPNPDWAQNDASEPDYVDNRTHYDIPAVSLPDAFITFRWTEEDYSDLMFYLNDETPMPRMSENTWGVQLGQWLLSCYINGNVLEVDLDGDPILTVANFRPGRTPQPIPVGDIEVPELVQQLDGKYLALKTVNGQSVKGSGDITLNGSNLEYTGNDGDAVIIHGDSLDDNLKALDDKAYYLDINKQGKINDLDTIRAGAAAGATAYQKPSTGIPKSALASAVKTSLEKADTALQPSDLNGYATEGYVDQEVYEQVSGVVKYTEQELTDAQKEQARANIGAADESEVSQLRSEVEDIRQDYQDDFDFGVSDDKYNILAYLKDGEIKTKNFDSKETPAQMGFYDDADLYIADEEGNAVVAFKDGHVKTKNFDSSKLPEEGVGVDVTPSVFSFSTDLLDMDDELDGFYPHATDSIGCDTFVTQIITKIDSLVTEFPGMLTKQDAASVVGLQYPSYANLNGQASGSYLATPSYTIPIYHFTDTTMNIGVRKQKVFIVAGIHGWENASQFNTYVLLNKLCRCASVDYMALRASVDLYVIPCVNMYGAFHASATDARKNANAVDINRNFPNPAWRVIGTPSDMTYSGPSPASEFETQLIIKWAAEIVPDIMIDHHSYGSFVNYNFYRNFSTEFGRKIGYQNLYSWTARGCLSYPEHYGTAGALHPNGFLIDHDQTCTGWAYYAGIADAATVEVSIGIGFKDGERYPTLNEYIAADTEWKEPSIQMNELGLRLDLMKYVWYHTTLGIVTDELNDEMLIN